VTTEHEQDVQIVKDALWPLGNGPARIALRRILARLEKAEASDAESLRLYRSARDRADVLAARVRDLKLALQRIEGHTGPNVVPGTPAPDPKWINAIARAALRNESPEGEL